MFFASSNNSVKPTGISLVNYNPCVIDFPLNIPLHDYSLQPKGALHTHHLQLRNQICGTLSFKKAVGNSRKSTDLSRNLDTSATSISTVDCLVTLRSLSPFAGHFPSLRSLMSLLALISS